jgi:hypothetical protein
MISYSSKRFALLLPIVVSFVLSGDVFGFTIFSVGGNDKPASIQVASGLPWETPTMAMRRVHLPVVAAKSTGTGAAPQLTLIHLAAHRSTSSSTPEARSS